MDVQNTTLDDIASVVGFTATLRLSAWFGEEGNLYVPQKAEEGQLLVALLGMSAAQRLSEEWPGEHLAVPRPKQYEIDFQRKQVTRLIERGFTTRQVAHWLRCSERRVQQYLRDMEVAGILPVQGPEKSEG